MFTPPSPGLIAILLETARRAGWIPVSGEYGRLDGVTLVVCAGDSPGSVRWHVSGDLPARGAPRLLSKAAYEALRSGELATDGSLVLGGKRFRLADVWTGTELAAALDPAT